LPNIDFNNLDVDYDDKGTVVINGEALSKEKIEEQLEQVSEEVNQNSFSINQWIEKTKDNNFIFVVFLIMQILFLLTSPVMDKAKRSFLEHSGLNEFYEQSGIYELIESVFEHLFRKVPQGIFDPVSENMRKLESLFPSAVKDGQLDIEALKEELGLFEDVSVEKYELTWAGKQVAKKLSQTDIVGRTLKYVPEDSKNPETTQNLYIEGDNLEVLKLLRQNYYGAVKMIYIDPPYNTGNDFV